MAATARRRGFGEDSIYFDAANNCWTAAVSMGYSPDGKRRVRRKVTGRTKTAVRDKLRALRRELDAGVQSSPTYTMAACVEDWLSQGLAGRSAGTVANYRYAAKHVVAKLGAVKLRELTARHVQAALAVYRSVRASGDTKTPKSRRVLKLPVKAVEALKDHRSRQAAARLKAGPLWQDHGLVFASAAGTPLDAHNVRRSFRAITKAAGLGQDWTPRELRHTFVSLLSANDVNLEDIARLAGHSGTSVTERVYRHEIRPSLTQGAEIMDQLFQ